MSLAGIIPEAGAESPVLEIPGIHSAAGAMILPHIFLEILHLEAGVVIKVLHPEAGAVIEILHPEAGAAILLHILLEAGTTTVDTGTVSTEVTIFRQAQSFH